MESWLIHFTTQSLEYSLYIITIISFIESLALIGLLLPGIVLMTALGTLIGQQKIGFYSACIASTIGCLLGDWISFFIGSTLKTWLHNLYFFQKNTIILNKTKYALCHYSKLTIFLGRLIGPTRPIIPMLSGMLKLPLKKFLIPNFLGCLLWPPIYFLPGIFTGILIHTPYIIKNNYFLWIFLIIICINWLGFWLLWKWKSLKKDIVLCFSIKISPKKFLIFSLIILLIGLSSFILIQFCTEMFVIRNIIWKIIFCL